MKKPYFVFDPEGDGLMTFATVEERDAFAEWSVREWLKQDYRDATEWIVCGVITHRVEDDKVVEL